MIFNTYWFLAFIGVFFPVYWFGFSRTFRAIWLLAACVVFQFHFAGLVGALPILVLGAITYLCALSRKPLLCAISIVLSVLALIFYKYTAFLSQELLARLHPALAGWAAKDAARLLPSVPPLGISFFVFEFVHYLVEIRRGGEPLRKPLDFALFALFFPSMVAGPIKRYRAFSESLQEGLPNVSPSDVAEGFKRLAMGFAKKMLVADNLTLAIRYYEERLGELSRGELWLFVAALAARILFDFSGYSDMAIGIARMMGIRLPENFNYPYLARNISDFWSRWHISLSSWIRDYIYIPLGGNRHGFARRVVNGFVAFALCGLWHGAAWNFVLWGLWHGAGLVTQAAFERLCGPSLGAVLRKLRVLSWALTLLFVCLGWLLFFYPPEKAWWIATRLFLPR